MEFGKISEWYDFSRQERLYWGFNQFLDETEEDIVVEIGPTTPLWSSKDLKAYGDLTLYARIPRMDGKEIRAPIQLPVSHMEVDGKLVASVFAILTHEFREVIGESRIACETVLHILEKDEAQKDLYKRLISIVGVEG